MSGARRVSARAVQEQLGFAREGFNASIDSLPLAEGIPVLLVPVSAHAHELPAPRLSCRTKADGTMPFHVKHRPALSGLRRLPAIGTWAPLKARRDLEAFPFHVKQLPPIIGGQALALSSLREQR